MFIGDKSNFRAAMKYFLLPMAVTLCAFGGHAGADVVVDYSPDALTGSLNNADYTNNSNGQNFLVKFILNSTTTISGMDIYMDSSYASAALGLDAVVRVRSDNSGWPDSANLYEINTTVAAVDAVGDSKNDGVGLVHVDFSPITLSAGQYYIGTSSPSTNFTWAAYNTGSANGWQASGETVQGPANSLGTFAYRVSREIGRSG